MEGDAKAALEKASGGPVHAISAVAQIGMTEVQRELAAIIRAEEARLVLDLEEHLLGLVLGQEVDQRGVLVGHLSPKP